MSQIPIPEQIQVSSKLAIKDLDFDNLENDELEMIRDEINIILKMNDLKTERMAYFKLQLEEEKNKLRQQMQKDLKKERDKLVKELKDQLEEDEGSTESVIYDKKNPKGKVTKKIVNKKK